MHTGTNPRWRLVVAVTLAAALGVSACSVATSTAADSEAGDQRDSTAVPQPEAPAADVTPGASTDPDPDSPSTAQPTATSVETSEPPAPAANFRADNVLTLSSNGAFAYAGTSSPWNEWTRCDAEPTETLAVADVRQAAEGAAAPVAAGLIQTGDIRQLVFGPGASAVAITSCGPVDQPQVWMQQAEFGADGAVANLGDAVTFELGDNEAEPYVLGWTDADTIEVRVLVEVDPADYETWVVERRQITVATGQVVSVQQFDFDSDDGWNPRVEAQSPDGAFTYRDIEDPNEALGCEGFGVARTLEVTAGGETRPALPPALVFSTIDDLHFGPDGLVAWTTGCEGFVTAYVGRIQADGSIADAHYLEANQGLIDSYLEFRDYRLTPDGHLSAVGASFAYDNDDSEPAFWYVDLSQDPSFVNSAEPALAIDDQPLLEGIVAGETWHVGPTLAAQPACGATTLYGRTADGDFVRAFPADQEVEAIVDADSSATHTFENEFGPGYSVRTVVLSVECPTEFDGRRIYYGVESGTVQWGMGMIPADLSPVAQVLGVRESRGADGYFDASYVEVELIDGTVAEFELTPGDGY